MSLAAKDAGLTMDGSVASMMALQQAGGLISDKVLPHFAKRMSEAARANGGLDKAMLSNRVAMNRMVLAFQEAGDLIFKSGFAEGLTELFNTLAEAVVDLSPLWESLGKIIGSVFSLISDGVKAVTPTLIALSNILKSITDALGEGGAFLVTLIGPAMMLLKVIKGLDVTMLALASRVTPWVAGISAALLLFKEMAFWAEEIDNLLFSRDKVGLLFDVRTGNSSAAGTNIAAHALGSKANTGMGIGDSMMASLMNMFTASSIGEFVSRGMGSSINAGAFLGNKMTIQGVVNIDGNKVGDIISNNQAVKDSIQTEIKKVQN
jgi:hypothetical protein